jgi:hypothetical protein
MELRAYLKVLTSSSNLFRVWEEDHRLGEIMSDLGKVRWSQINVV